MPSTYIGKVSINDEYIPIGSTMLGRCSIDQNNNTINTKTATDKYVNLPGYDNPSDGLLISVWFEDGNEANNINLIINSEPNASNLPRVRVEGDARCGLGDTLSFVYESNGNGNCWRVLYSSLRNKLETINTSISNISSAMHFKSTVSEIPPATGTYEPGDVVLAPNNKEYVYDGTNWIELGDEGSYLLKDAITTAQVIKSVEISNDNNLPSLSIGNVTTNFPQLITGLATPAQNETGEVITDIPITTYTPKKVTTINVPTTLSVSHGVLIVTPGRAMELEDDDAITVIDTSNGQNIEKKKLTTTSVTFSPGTRQTLSTETETVYKPAPQQSGG